MLRLMFRGAPEGAKREEQASRSLQTGPPRMQEQHLLDADIVFQNACASHLFTAQAYAGAVSHFRHATSHLPTSDSCGSAVRNGSR